MQSGAGWRGRGQGPVTLAGVQVDSQSESFAAYVAGVCLFVSVCDLVRCLLFAVKAAVGAVVTKKAPRQPELRRRTRLSVDVTQNREISLAGR